MAILVGSICLPVLKSLFSNRLHHITIEYPKPNSDVRGMPYATLFTRCRTESVRNSRRPTKRRNQDRPCPVSSRILIQHYVKFIATRLQSQYSSKISLKRSAQSWSISEARQSQTGSSSASGKLLAQAYGDGRF